MTFENESTYSLAICVTYRHCTKLFESNKSLTFRLSLHLHPYFVYMGSKGPDDTVCIFFGHFEVT